MSDSDGKHFEEDFDGTVPCDCFDVETPEGLLHVDTFDREAARRWREKRAQRSKSADASPPLTQNPQNSG
jgi:hypothetical protein